MSATQPAGYVLAFDLGTRTIGVAIGHRETGMARALTTLTVRAGHPDWPTLDSLVKEWQPAAFVVGLPLTRDGGEQEMTRIARDFSARLGTRHARPVHLVDERHTSKEAARRFANQRAQGAAKRKHGTEVDALAAQIILETWFSLPDDEADTP